MVSQLDLRPPKGEERGGGAAVFFVHSLSRPAERKKSPLRLIRFPRKTPNTDRCG